MASNTSVLGGEMFLVFIALCYFYKDVNELVFTVCRPDVRSATSNSTP